MTGLCERLTSLKLWEYQRHYRVDVLAFVGDVLRQFRPPALLLPRGLHVAILANVQIRRNSVVVGGYAMMVTVRSR